jgi:hypothetical protein
MKIQQMVRELERAAAQLGLKVRTEKGGFRGGRCVVSGEGLVVLNRRHPPEAHFAILAESLRELPVDAVYLPPAVRAALEASWQRRLSVDVDLADGE